MASTHNIARIPHSFIYSLYLLVPFNDNRPHFSHPTDTTAPFFPSALYHLLHYSQSGGYWRHRVMSYTTRSNLRTLCAAGNSRSPDVPRKQLDGPPLPSESEREDMTAALLNTSPMFEQLELPGLNRIVAI